ncbi:hypothetical protein FOZ61_001794 [Perkinsus olseni]|uniref:Uncharacterized protein n=1 Tax=Perkinsus olseni TaxID=32597 RepID=A0A7J6KNZ7_PEROL|nr:hypothetical protein FOZ61_001794 [Perkinsus olseni]
MFHSPPYSPASHGAIEKVNSIVLNLIRKSGLKLWYACLPLLLLSALWLGVVLQSGGVHLVPPPSPPWGSPSPAVSHDSRDSHAPIRYTLPPSYRATPLTCSLSRLSGLSRSHLAHSASLLSCYPPPASTNAGGTHATSSQCASSASPRDGLSAGFASEATREKWIAMWFTATYSHNHPATPFTSSEAADPFFNCRVVSPCYTASVTPCALPRGRALHTSSPPRALPVARCHVHGSRARSVLLSPARVPWARIPGASARTRGWDCSLLRSPRGRALHTTPLPRALPAARCHVHAPLWLPLPPRARSVLSSSLLVSWRLRLYSTRLTRGLDRRHGGAVPHATGLCDSPDPNVPSVVPTLSARCGNFLGAVL